MYSVREVRFLSNQVVTAPTSTCRGQEQTSELGRCTDKAQSGTDCASSHLIDLDPVGLDVHDPVTFDLPGGGVPRDPGGAVVHV